MSTNEEEVRDFLTTWNELRQPTTPGAVGYYDVEGHLQLVR
jgi:hypothetical protein